MVIASFLFFLFVITGIGIASSFLKKQTHADYLLANHSIPPWLVGLSAVATNNSGYMFIGMIGFSYSVGLSSMWLMIGWVFGDLLVSFLVHRRVREAVELRDVMSFGDLLSKWQGGDYRKLRVVTGLVTVVFLGVYAAAQFNAGSKALHVLFGWDYNVGALIGSLIVLIYCLSGGIRATIWTDAAQSVVMFISMLSLFFVALQQLGSVDIVLNNLTAISPTFMSVWPSDLLMDNFVGIGLFVLGWLLAGVGVIGQPHIMSRFMAISDASMMNRARTYYYLWYVTFSALTIGVGLLARLLLPDVATFDAELALPTVSQQLLPSIMVGFVLAGIFSATMSTADSQILSCTAAVVRDITSLKNTSLVVTKGITCVLTVCVLMVALYGSKSVFKLVLVSWSVLAAAFAPLLIIYALRQSISERLAIIVVASGVAATLTWRQLGFSNVLYEVGPGIVCGLAVYFILKMTPLNRT